MSAGQPATHRPPRWFVALLAFVLLLCALGLGLELASPESRPELALSYGFFTLLTIAALVESLVSSVTVDEREVRIRGLFGSRTVPLDQVDYVRAEGRGVQLRLKSDEWLRMPPPDWLRASPGSRRRLAAEIEAALQDR